MTKTEYSNFQLRKYEFKEELKTEEDLIFFMDSVRNQQVEATYKSEAVIEEKDQQKVRKIVGHTFIVRNHHDGRFMLCV